MGIQVEPAEWKPSLLISFTFWLLVSGLLWRGVSPQTVWRKLRHHRLIFGVYLEAVVEVTLGQRISPARGFVVARLAVDSASFIVAWTCVALILWWLAPGALVTSSDSAASLSQAIPAAVVAIYVLALGSLFVVAQLSIAAYGHRVVLLFIDDPLVARVAIRPLILASAAVVLAGQVPPSDAPTPPEPLAAALSAVILATVGTLARSGQLLIATLLRYTAPVSLVNITLEPVAIDFAAGHPLAVRFKVPLLEEMAKLGLRRGDSAAVHAALMGLERLAVRYAEAAESDPGLRIIQLADTDGEAVDLTAWFGTDLAESLERIAEEGFRLQAPSTDVDASVSELELGASVFLRRGLHEEATACTHSLTMLGMSSHQVGQGFINIQARPAGCLARVEAVAEDVGDRPAAADALAGWAATVSYHHTHFGKPEDPMAQHPLWRSSLENLGGEPPWDQAREILVSRQFQRSWANQLDWGIGPVVAYLMLAGIEHTAMQAGDPLPLPPSLQDLMTFLESEATET